MHPRKRLLFFALLGIWFMFANQPTVAAKESNKVCDEVCGSGTRCDHECWLTQFDFDQDYPSTTCEAESYACCGDGVCDPANDCFSCTVDCGEPEGAECAGVCDDDSQCDSGEFCNAMHGCTLPSPNNGGIDPGCSNKNDCFAPDACMTSGECVLPWKDECSGGTACTTTSQCHYIFNDDTYCNPGNNRCMNTLTPGCAS